MMVVTVTHKQSSTLSSQLEPQQSLVLVAHTPEWDMLYSHSSEALHSNPFPQWKLRNL